MKKNVQLSQVCNRHVEFGFWDLASDLVHEALDYGHASQNDLLIARCLRTQASMHRMEGRFSQALQCVQEACRRPTPVIDYLSCLDLVASMCFEAQEFRELNEWLLDATALVDECGRAAKGTSLSWLFTLATV